MPVSLRVSWGCIKGAQSPLKNRGRKNSKRRLRLDQNSNNKKMEFMTVRTYALTKVNAPLKVQISNKLGL